MSSILSALDEFPKTIFSVALDLVRSRPISADRRAKASLELRILRWVVWASVAFSGLALWLAYIGWSPTNTQLLAAIGTPVALVLLGLTCRDLLRMSDRRQIVRSLSLKGAGIALSLLVLFAANLLQGHQVLHPDPGLITANMLLLIAPQFVVMIGVVEALAARLRATRQ